MKKLLSLALSILIALSLAACGNSEERSGASSPDSTQQPAANSTSPSTAPSTGEDGGTATPNIVPSDLKASEGLEFESNGDGTCTLVGMGVCTDTDLVIPTESPNGDTVTLLEEYAFMSLEDVDSVTLLNYNYEVEDGAFQYAEMTAVSIIGGAPFIGENAFSSCEDLTSITLQQCALQLDQYAFFDCGNGASVAFSDCTGTVDKYAFQYSDLVSLSMDGCDLTLEESVFSSCEDLTAITLQDSTITAMEYSFYGVGDSANVTVEQCALTLDDYAFQFSSLGEVKITGDFLEVGESAFSSCEDLTAVTIDCASVTLGEDAFFGCEDLTTVSICNNDESDNAVYLDDGAFQYCSCLTSVTVGNGTIELGDAIFYGCAENLSVSIAGKPYTALD